LKEIRLQTAAAHQIATIDLEEGDLASARDRFFEVLALSSDNPNRHDEASLWHQIATIDMRSREYQAARENFLRSLELRRSLGMHAGLATTLNSLGRIDIQLGEFALAKSRLTEALAIARWLGTPAEEAETWHHLGLLAIGLGRPHKGVRLLALGHSRFEAIGHADAQQAQADLKQTADALGYTLADIKRIVAEVKAAYDADGGQTLYRGAFGEDLPTVSDD
jgi:tetratricopeptide (TPR) repeat protein